MLNEVTLNGNDKDEPSPSSSNKIEKKESLTQKFSKIFKTKKTVLEESIQDILEENGESETPLNQGEREILKNVLEFKQLHVEDVMIPRADLFAVAEDIGFDEMQTLLADKTYTRIPTYKGDMDEITGFIHIKDIARIFFNKKEFDINEIKRKCLFVPSSMKISNLLIRMQINKTHVAIVVDEYGGTDGIITLEDIVEEIVGNIEDEHDAEERKISIKKISEDIFETTSRASIEDIKESTNLDLHTEENEDQYDTIGGLITYKLGRIPAKGEVIEFNDSIELEVTDADARTIRRVLIKNKN